MSSPAFELSDELVSALARAGDEFVVQCMRHEVGVHPRNLGALAELGHALTRLGRYDEGLEVDRALLALCPGDPLVHYNLACSLCLVGQRDEAITALQRACELGYTGAAHMLEDADLAALRGDPRFDALVEALRRRDA